MGTRRQDAEAKTPAKFRPKVGCRPQDNTERPGAATKARKPDKQAGAASTAPEDYQALFRQLVARANSGERLAIDRLKKFLDLNPYIWQRAGDLTAVAERGWVELIAGADQFRTESVKRRLAQLKAELKGATPTPLEALLIDLIGVIWLATQHAGIEAASSGGTSLAQAAFKLKRAESSQKRLLNAAKTLATLRALVPAGLVPARPLRLHDPDQQLA
jgi:hypothetical protein